MHLIIFDCDGTLVDSQHIIVAAMTRAFHANGLELPLAVAGATDRGRCGTS